MPFIAEMPMDNSSPHGLPLGPEMFPPLDPSLESYPHQPMIPPMMGPEGNSIMPLEPHPPMSPPIPGPEDNSIIPVGPHPPLSPPVPGPEGNSMIPIQPHPLLIPPVSGDDQPSAPPFFVEGPPPPPPHALQPSFDNYPGVITEYPNYHNATSFPRQLPQHFGYLYPDHVVPNFRPKLSSNSCQTTCPSCHFVVQTKVQKETGVKAHLAALGMCLLMCWPCCLLPYFMDTCKNASHYCPRCGAFLGSYKM